MTDVLRRSLDKQLWIPLNFIEGLVVLREAAVLSRKTADCWSKKLEGGLIWGGGAVVIKGGGDSLSAPACS